MSALEAVENLRLSFAERHTVARQLFDGKSYAEIAAQDGIRIESARKNEYRATSRQVALRGDPEADTQALAKSPTSSSRH